MNIFLLTCICPYRPDDVLSVFVEGDCVRDSVFEFGLVLLHPLIEKAFLHHQPKSLERIQFRAVRWQIPRFDAAPLKLLDMVKAGIVQGHDHPSVSVHDTVLTHSSS